MRNQTLRTKGRLISVLAVGVCLLAACGDDAEKNKAGFPEVAQQPQTPASKGERLFKQNCTTCHNMKFDATGPALAGVLGRWNNDTSRIKAYIRNPSKMIEAGDPEAVRAYEKYKPTVMTPFPGLTDEELDQLIAYLRENGG